MRISAALIGFVLALFLASSCNVEKKLAMTFVNEGAGHHILFFPTNRIYLVNQKREILDSLDIQDEALYDSVLYANSIYLKNLNDSLFMANYILGYESELRNLGLHVYDEDQTLDFMNLDSNAYVAHMAQVELEETLYDYRAGETIYGEYYYYDFDLNAVVVNSWFELKEYNKTADGEQIYFATDLITDDFEGEFYPDVFAGEVRFAYNIDTLKTEALYNFAHLLGRKYATYTFDWMVNKYLDDHLPKDKRSDNYWRYDPYRKDFYITKEDRFIPLDE